MTPSGMLTIPEALKLIRARIDDDDLLLQRHPKPSREEAARESLATAILNKNVEIYTLRGGALYRIENHSLFARMEDTTDVQEAMDGWETWLSSGRIRKTGKYNGCRLFPGNITRRRRGAIARRCAGGLRPSSDVQPCRGSQLRHLT